MEANRIVLSVVCPAFNEEQVLPLFHRQLSAALTTVPTDYQIEIIYVDDGSRDRTLEVLRDLVRQDARVRFLSFSRNFGHQAALTAGMEAARGDLVLTMDSDLQHPPTLIPALLEQWQAGHDVVITIRDDSQSPNRLEHFLSRWFYNVMGCLSDTEIRPAAADFRLMSRPAVDALLRMGDQDRFLRGMVQWLGYPAAEIHYVPARRGAGHSKYSFRRKVRFALDGILSFSRVPLRLPLVVGGMAVAFGLAAMGYALLRGLLGGGEAGAFRPLLLGSLHLLGGGILCALGVFGEYLGRIYDQVRGRPIYVLKEESHPAAGHGHRLIRRPAGKPPESQAPAA
jgi:glycosyltransferase involved in cell wall biosynthesis